MRMYRQWELSTSKHQGLANFLPKDSSHDEIEFLDTSKGKCCNCCNCRVVSASDRTASQDLKGPKFCGIRDGVRLSLHGSHTTSCSRDAPHDFFNIRQKSLRRRSGLAPKGCISGGSRTCSRELRLCLKP